eukprot:2913398-Alexandrium_andersonii.AAC.1
MAPFRCSAPRRADLGRYIVQQKLTRFRIDKIARGPALLARARGGPEPPPDSPSSRLRGPWFWTPHRAPSIPLPWRVWCAGDA